MNERIKELITQAGGYWNYGDFGLPNNVEFQESDIEKLVELIVQECIETLSTARIWTHKKQMTILKEHFGVE